MGEGRERESSPRAGGAYERPSPVVGLVTLRGFEMTFNMGF